MLSKQQLDNLFSSLSGRPERFSSDLADFSDELKSGLRDLIQHKGDLMKRKFQQKIEKNLAVAVVHARVDRAKKRRAPGLRAKSIQKAELASDAECGSSQSSDEDDGVQI